MKTTLLLLALLVIPPLFAADSYVPTDPERARWTYFDIRSIATCVEAYAVDHKSYPAAGDMTALLPPVQPKYVITLPMHDAWGYPYRFSGTATGYRIVSAGSDGVFDESSWSTPAKNLLTSADVVYENGKFVRSWSFK